jgi:glutathione synthase
MKYLIIIDPIETLISDHDTSIGMMEAIKMHGGEFWLAYGYNLYSHKGNAFVNAFKISFSLDTNPWYKIVDNQTFMLKNFDIILMRKDPPFDMSYIFITYILDMAERDGVLVANRPNSLRNLNEKGLLNFFPQLTTDFLISAEIDTINNFINKHKDVVIKPMDSMGGDSVYRLKIDNNNSKILQQITHNQTKMIMIMEYIPEVVVGDKRILLINGKPASHALLRTPPAGQLQANIAAGGTGTVVPLTANDYKICETIARFCMQHGLYFVGIDVIGNFVTEINITSPTCLREISAYTKQNLALEFIKGLEKHVDK